MTADWSPSDYLRFTDERSRPFADLLARIPAAAPASVADLGSGPGHLTALLRERWPGAQVTGVDSSPAMVERARTADPATRYVLGDVRDYAAGALEGVAPQTDVVVSNATLQWVPGHRDLLPALAARARQAFAFQVPGNHDAPSHRALREVAARPPYAAALSGPVERRTTADPAEYLEILAGPDRAVDAWETTYVHVLQGADPVLRWISATGAQPTLHALAAHDRAHGTGLLARFEADLGAELRAAYPERTYGTPLEFRRVFVVITHQNDTRSPGAAS